MTGDDGVLRAGRRRAPSTWCCARCSPAEVNRLTELGLRVCRSDPALRDTTRRGLREALVEVLAALRRLPRLPAARPVRPTTPPAHHVDAAVATALAVAAAPGRGDRRRAPAGAGRGPGRPRRRRSSSRASSRPAARSWPRASRTPPSTATCGCRRSTRSAATPAASAPPVDEFHAACVATQRALAAVDDDPVDPRHEALRGRPRPAGAARAVPGRVGRGRHPLARRRRARTAPPPVPTPPPSSWSGRRWSAPGR